MLTEGARLQLARFLQANIEKYTDALVRAVALTQARDYRREDLHQIIVGYVAILCESLTEDTRDKRSFYLETVIPGLVMNGETLPKLVYGSSSVSFIISGDILRNFKTDAPEPLADWVADYFASFLRDMMASALATVEPMRSTPSGRTATP